MNHENGLLDRMEGAVIELNDGSFSALLVAEDGEESTAEIWITQVQPEDIHLIRPGALFIWEFYMDSTQQPRSKITFLKEQPGAE